MDGTYLIQLISVLAVWAQPGHDTLPRVDPYFQERFDKDHIKWAQNRIEGMKEMIAWYEEFATRPGRFSPERVSKFLQTAEEWRADLTLFEEYRDELLKWELQRKTNPGGQTDRDALNRLKSILARMDGANRVSLAPPPREKK